MRKSLSSVAVACAVILAAPSSDADLREGYEAFADGRYEQAYEELLPLAGRNNPIAAYYLGIMYLDGAGVARDAQAGVLWLTRAAERGHTAAQLRLALVYERGDGIVQDYQLASQWMTAAAEGGNADAHYYLGRYYRDGRGLVQSDALAHEWIYRSVEYDISHDRFLDALLYLGAASEWGRGQRQDLVDAYKWFALASGYSVDDARMHEEAGRAMDALSIRMSATQLAEAQRRAEAWRRDKQAMVANR